MVENNHRDIAGLGKSLDDLDNLCPKRWEDDYYYVYIVRSEKKYEVKQTIQNKKKNTHIQFKPERQTFYGCVGLKRNPTPIVLNKISIKPNMLNRI